MVRGLENVVQAAALRELVLKEVNCEAMVRVYCYIDSSRSFKKQNTDQLFSIFAEDRASTNAFQLLQEVI